MEIDTQVPVAPNGLTAVENATVTVLNFLSRKQILDADDRRYDVVQVPEWGGAVRIRNLTGNERDKFEKSITKVGIVEGKPVSETIADNLRAKLVTLGVIDEKDVRIFTLEDAAALGEKSNAALDRCFQAIAKLSGMGEEAKKATGEGSAQTPRDGAASA